MNVEDNVYEYSPTKFIDYHVDLLYADGNDHLVKDWSLLPDREFAYNLAGYVFNGAVNMWWEQRNNGRIVVRPALVLTTEIQ